MDEEINSKYFIMEKTSREISSCSKLLAFLRSNVWTILSASFSLTLSVVSILLVSSVRDDVNFAKGQLSTIISSNENLLVRMSEMSKEQLLLDSNVVNTKQEIVKMRSDVMNIGVCDVERLIVTKSTSTKCRWINIYIQTGDSLDVIVIWSNDNTITSDNMNDREIQVIGSNNKINLIRTKRLIVTGNYNNIGNTTSSSFITRFASSSIIQYCNFNIVTSQLESVIHIDKIGNYGSFVGTSNSLIIIMIDQIVKSSCLSHGVIMFWNGTLVC
jgi:hypothetical protein